MAKPSVLINSSWKVGKGTARHNYYGLINTTVTSQGPIDHTSDFITQPQTPTLIHFKMSTTTPSLQAPHCVRPGALSSSLRKSWA